MPTMRDVETAWPLRSLDLDLGRVPDVQAGRVEQLLSPLNILRDLLILSLRAAPV